MTAFTVPPLRSAARRARAALSPKASGYRRPLTGSPLYRLRDGLGVGLDRAPRPRHSHAPQEVQHRLAPPRAGASRGMSGRQGAESGRCGSGGDAASVSWVGVGEVAPETGCGSVQVSRSGWQVDERQAIALGRHALPDRPEDAEIGEPILARGVKRERTRQRARYVQACDSRAEGRFDLLLALFLGNEHEQVREPRELPLPRPSRGEAQVALA